MPPVIELEVVPAKLEVDSVNAITQVPVNALVSSPLSVIVRVKAKFILGVESLVVIPIVCT